MFVTFIYTDLSISEFKVRRSHVVMFRNWIKESKNKDYSNNTINRVMSTVKAFYDFLIEEEMVNTNPSSNIKDSHPIPAIK